MNDADPQPAVAAEFVALADLLESATAEQWDTPSLCAGWRVREVTDRARRCAAKAEDLALFLCGRTIPGGRIEGKPL